MTSKQPRTYKHQLTADEFKFVFTATAEEFAARADDMRSKGVERLTGAEIKGKYHISVGRRTNKVLFTLVADAEVDAESNEPITFRDILAPVPNLLLWRSKTPILRLVGCTLAKSKNGQAGTDTTSFHFIESVTGDFVIREQSTMGDFIIEQSTMGDITIYNSEVAVFKANDLFSSFDLTKATIAQFRLEKCNLPELRIASGCRMECYIANSAINLIDLQRLTLSKESVVSIFDCLVYACLMEEFAMLGSLFFRQIKRADKPFTWDDPDAIRNGNERRLVALQQQAPNYEWHKERLVNKLEISHSTFRIAQSSLGKTEFTNCNLGGFRFEFTNAKITETFISGGTTPEENIFIHGETEGSLVWHEQKVSVYNQLKKIFDGQGDVYRATHFQAKTAEHQQRVLKLRHQNEKGMFSTTFWDLWTFRLNQWSNLHGESWGRALLFTLGIASLFYVFFLLSIGRLFRPTAFDWNLVGQYFQFLDPTHKVDFVKDATLNVGSYVADYTGRVFIAYGIFQFISAFRKHGKK